MKPELLIDSITKVVNDYGKNSAGATIDELLRWEDLLSGYNFHMAELEARAAKEFDYAFYAKRVELIEQDMPISKAEAIAKNETKDWKHLANRLTLVRVQGNRVIDAMRQRISVLKKEKDD